MYKVCDLVISIKMYMPIVLTSKEDIIININIFRYT